MAGRFHGRTFAAAALALSLAGCSSGGGPLNKPEVSVDSIVGTAVAVLAADGRFGSGRHLDVIYLLDHPAMRLDRLPGPIRDAFPSGRDRARTRR